MLSGKVALITGASSGIGRATALTFCKEGAKIAITGRNEERLRESKEMCIKEGSIEEKIFTIIGDLSKEDDTERIVKQTVDHFKKIDILVNNAGITKKGTIETTTMQDFDEVMNINMRSIYHITMLVVPHLIEAKGNIVNVSSVNGLRSYPNQLAYNMSKAALDQFTSCIALELADKQVRVNSVNPALIETPILTTGGWTEQENADAFKRSTEVYPMKRFGQAEEVAQSILFLACDKSSSFTSGVKLPVDGARSLMCPR